LDEIEPRFASFPLADDRLRRAKIMGQLHLGHPGRTPCFAQKLDKNTVLWRKYGLFHPNGSRGPLRMLKSVLE